MRLSDLLRASVVDAEGRVVGPIHDVQLVQDGPYIEGFGSALRIDGVVAGKGSFAVSLGFVRGQVVGPKVLSVLFRRLEHRARYVRWDDIASIEDGVVHLRPGAELLRVPGGGEGPS